MIGANTDAILRPVRDGERRECRSGVRRCRSAVDTDTRQVNPTSREGVLDGDRPRLGGRDPFDVGAVPGREFQRVDGRGTPLLRHLAEFLEGCEERAGPRPAFVKAELEGFAGCGDFESPDRGLTTAHRAAPYSDLPDRK